jgi:polyhydroxyalkanoate synthesis regulator phasin
MVRTIDFELLYPSQGEIKHMEATNTMSELGQPSEVEKQVHNETNKQEKIKVSLDNLKTPTASETFKARVTCQRRS